MSDIDWGDLADAFARVDAEAEAELAADPRDEVARKAGVSLWAYSLYQDLLKTAYELAEEQGEDVDERETAETFQAQFVQPLERAQARISWDGAKVDSVRELDGTMTIELSGRGSFVLYMALRVAGSVLTQMGHLALGSSGLEPSLDDTVETCNLAKALAVCLPSVSRDTPDDYFNGVVIDARR